MILLPILSFNIPMKLKPTNGASKLYIGQIRDKFWLTLIFVDIPPKMSMRNSSPIDLH